MMDHENAEALEGPAEGFDAFVASWRFKPHRWRTVAEDPALGHATLERLTSTLARPGVRAWQVRAGKTIRGVAILQPLAWDSKVLGVNAARVELIIGPHDGKATAAALLPRVVDTARRLELRHLSVRVDAADDASIHALEDAGFLNVDVLLTFRAAVIAAGIPASTAGIVLRDGVPADAAVVGELAASNFRDGRFHADPSLTQEQADAVYRTWAASCCAGTAADKVIVAVAAERVAGFVACVLDPGAGGGPTGTITLIASARDLRRRGVGSLLVGAAVDWFRTRGAAAVEVGTQLRNIAAARLYGRCGFSLVGGSLSFRTIIQP